MSRVIIIAVLLLGAAIGGYVLYGVQDGDDKAEGAVADYDPAVLSALRTGDMQKLVIHDTPKPRIEKGFQDGAGSPVTLADYEGKVVVLNFWATWCPPCRKEMPSIDRLSAAMAGENVAVLALSVDRFGAPRIQKFFDEIGVAHLAILQDRKSIVAREARALGLPVTLLLDRQGREVGRLVGEAEWDTEAVKTLVSKLVDMTASDG